MTVPHPFLDVLAARIYAAASRTPAPKNSKEKKKDSASPDPSESPGDGTPSPSESPGGGGEESDPFGTILDFLIANPWIPGIVVAIVGINIGWRKLTERQNLNGQPLAPLGNIVSRSLRLMFKEDKTPVFMRPQKFAMRMRWLTWQRYWIIALVAAVFDLSAFSGIIPDQYEIVFTALIAVMILGGVQHMRLVFQRRHRILMQMFEVASAECKYPKGSELNPWGWVQITKWNGLYSPASTYVVFPPRFRSEDERIQQAFETNFNGTVSSEHTWVYTWESANNRVLCEPVPFITDNAPYPFPDEHPWDEFPLGIGPGGEEAVIPVSVFPHLLIAGTTGSGKDLDLETPLPVPVSDAHSTGWTTVGEVQVGDVLFDEAGRPCRVVGLSEVHDDHVMYRVSFSDGTHLDASEGHLWFTETRKTRESRWNARRKKVERRSLISEPGLIALQRLHDEQTDTSEVTLRQVAEAAGVHETSPWLLEIANHFGPVGEVQVVADFHYAAQTVTQQQKMAVYSAKSAWKALADYTPGGRVPSWDAYREECARLASEAEDSDVVTIRDVAEVLHVSSKVAWTVLQQRGIQSSRGHRSSGGRAIAVFPARAAWHAIADRRAFDKGSVWSTNRSVFLEKLAACSIDEEVTASNIARLLGVSPTQVRAVLKRLGVPCRVEKRTVALKVPEKVVRRNSAFARTYLGRQLIAAVLERAETPAHDQRYKRDLGAVRTTEEIRQTLRTRAGAANHSIPVAGSLDLPEAELPVPPYLLGVWLGDGSSMAGNFSGVDHEVAEFVQAEGLRVRERTPRPTPGRKPPHETFRIWHVEGLTTRLKNQKLLKKSTPEGSQKRIPPIYLRASIKQRQALLAGLLDTDGTVAPQGTVHFDNANKELAEQVLELARSLGHRATLIEGRATLYGKDCGPAYRVAFTFGESPFRLSRKSVAHQDRTQRHNPEKTRHRYITDIQPIPSVPARCIQVDSPSRLFLAGEAMIPTHNSVTQRTILLHALQSPDWRVSLIDPKRVELSAYTNHRNVVKVATELDESVALLEGVEQEMQSRYKRMEKEGVNHFKRLKNPPPAMMLMVDELFALLSPENIRSDEGKERDEMHARATVVIGSIARLGRAAGIHMVLATQRPDAKVLPGETKALATTTPILTPTGWTTVEHLQPGDCVFAPDGTPTRVTGVTDIMHNHDCYELTFSDGSRITADAGHLWVVNDTPACTTQDLYTHLHTPHSDPLRMPPTQVPDTLHLTEAAGHTFSSEPRHIADIQPCPSVPVKCIAVEHSSRQFLAGRTLIATHNSNLDARIAQGRMDTTPSLMVLDSEAATRIPKIKGRAMVRMGGEITEFQAYFLPEDSLMQVLEMSEALASEQMTVQDFKDLIEQARAEAGGKPAGKSRIPKIPVPRGLASKTSSWVERRKAAVERNEEEGRRFASQKATRKPRMKDSPATDSGGGVSPVGPGAPVSEDPPRRGLRARRSPAPAPEVSRRLEEPPDAVAPGTPGPAVADRPAREQQREHGEVRHEGVRGDEFEGFPGEGVRGDEFEGFPGEGMPGEGFAEEFGAGLEEGFEEDFDERFVFDDAGARVDSRSEGFADDDPGFGLDDDDDDDDIELVFEDEDGDYLPPLDLDEVEFLDDVRDDEPPSRVAGPSGRGFPPAAAPLPGVPSGEEGATPAAGASVSGQRPVQRPVPAPPIARVPEVGIPEVGVAPAGFVAEDEDGDAGEEDLFAAVPEAPWMPEDVGGSSGGPSPFGGAEYVAPATPSPAARPVLPPEEDDEDAPFI